MKGPIGVKLVAVFFALLSANALVQVGLVVSGRSAEPMTLTLLQLLSGLSAGAAAVGAWRRTSWAPEACVAYGVITTAMLIALPFLLDLEEEARFGIFSGAAVVLLFSVAAGWYLHRNHQAPVV